VAAVAFDGNADVDANAAALAAALARVRTGGVAAAARDDAQGRFRTGEAVGFVEEEIVAYGPAEATLAAVLVALADGAELITCIAGEDPPLPDGRVRELAPDGIELELSDGGQPSWWWLLAAE